MAETPITKDKIIREISVLWDMRALGNEDTNKYISLHIFMGSQVEV